MPGGFRLGWAQLPQTHGHAFSIGLFTDSDHFAQIALADGKARVFAGTDPDMDTQELEPRFVFVKEGNPLRWRTVQDSAMRPAAIRKRCAPRKAASWDACWAVA